MFIILVTTFHDLMYRKLCLSQKLACHVNFLAITVRINSVMVATACTHDFFDL